MLALFLFGLMGYRAAAVEGVSKARNGFGLASLAFAFYCLFGATGFALDPIMTAFEPPYRLRPVDEHTIVKDQYDEVQSDGRYEDGMARMALYHRHCQDPVIRALGDVREMSLLDLACGDGFYTRRFRDECHANPACSRTIWSILKARS